MLSARDIAESLSRWSPAAPEAAAWVLPELRTLLRAEFAGAYRPHVTATGWSLDFFHGAGVGAAGYTRIFRDYVAGLAQSETFIAVGRPDCVDVRQRNRVVSMRDIVRIQPEGLKFGPNHSLFRALGIAGHDQIRVLACEGPRLLSWIGATREEPFTEREFRLLRRLSGPLQKRLRLEHQIGASHLLAAALDVALEAISGPAFLVNDRLGVELVNRAGGWALQRDRTTVLTAIRASVESAGRTGPFTSIRVVASGWPPYRLVTEKQPDPVIRRLERAQLKWRLSARQSRVLELLVTGISNKEIAHVLGCSEPTVEEHVAELFRRSGARSRAGVVGLLLSIG